MHKVTIKAILLIAGLTAFGIATASGRGTITPMPPKIVKTVVDSQEKILVITGHNFGTTLPTVMLADQALEVRRFSQQEIMASLPHSLNTATYSVIITTGGRNRISSNIFSATLFSVKEATR